MINITLPLLLTLRICLDIIRHLSIYYNISECIYRIICIEVTHLIIGMLVVIPDNSSTVNNSMHTKLLTLPLMRKCAFRQL